MEQPALSVIVVTWNLRDLLRDCLRSVVGTTIGRDDHRSGGRGQEAASNALIPDPCSLPLEVIVVDNASADGSAEMVRREFPGVRVIVNGENLGFARANNQGIRASHGRYVLLLNNDTIAPPAALGGLVAFMETHLEAGAVGPRLLQPDGMPQPYAFGSDPTLAYLARRGLNRLLFRRYVHDWSTDALQEVDWVAGTCLLVRREASDRAGLLDEHIFMYFEDSDWCLRIRKAGWKVYYTPQVEITHLGGQSAIKNLTARRAYYESLQYFYRKHYGPLALGVLKACLPLYRLALHP